MIEWIEHVCKVPEGRDIGKPLVLRGWQRNEIRKIYDNPAGTRRALLSFGRKNAKSTLSACLLLAHLVGPISRVNSQLYSTAQSREQAAVIFNLAAKIVRMSPDLRDYVNIRDTAKQLYCPELGTLYRALSAEVSTSFGLSPVFIVHDELGQVRGPRSELYEALETATGAQENPLSIVISTQAPTDADLFSVLLDDALEGNDPSVVVSLHTAPLDMDPFSVEAIKLANPAFGDFLNEREVLAMAEDAKRMPSREQAYRNLVLNQRVEARSPFISRETWRSCGAPVLPIAGVPIYGGLDLSATTDLTAMVLIGKVADVWQVHPTFWLPADGLADKSRRDRVPYDQWARQGDLATTPGKAVDYQFVALELAGVFAKYQVEKIAFDKWNWLHLRPWLIAAGFTEEKIDKHFVPLRQNWEAMTPALRDLEGAILNRKLAHGNHPVLTMCAGNAVVIKDGKENRMLTKAKSSGRIDGMVALTMAFGAAPHLPEAEPVYQMQFA